MPIHNFQCERCSEVFKIRATDREIEAGLEPECPFCHSKDTYPIVPAVVSHRDRTHPNMTLPEGEPNTRLGVVNG